MAAGARPSSPHTADQVQFPQHHGDAEINTLPSLAGPLTFCSEQLAWWGGDGWAEGTGAVLSQLRFLIHSPPSVGSREPSPLPPGSSRPQRLTQNVHSNSLCSEEATQAAVSGSAVRPYLHVWCSAIQQEKGQLPVGWLQHERI